ncbi:hypothetical protein ACFXPV_28180 [Streptomyces sp. NPDC059118]|uniref:hypothetical protein n=1 Tax=unclassified Streptomyces TaxID=2593676 RepID=UPI00367F5298
MTQDSAVSDILDPAGQLRSQHVDQEIGDELVSHVHEFTLSHEPVTPAQVTAALYIPVPEVKRAVVLLRHLRLLRYSETFDSFLVICPESAQNELVVPLQQAVNNKRSELAVIHQQVRNLSGFFGLPRRSRRSSDEAVLLLDPQQASLHLADSLHHCTSEVLAMQHFVGRLHQSFPPTVLAKASNGVPIRLICPPLGPCQGGHQDPAAADGRLRGPGPHDEPHLRQPGARR